MSQSEFHGDKWFRPISRSFTVTAGGSAFTNGMCRAILVDVAGSVTVTYVDGTSDVVTLVAGVWHPMAITHITAATATGLHVGY